jgi:hypothetical protein
MRRWMSPHRQRRKQQLQQPPQHPRNLAMACTKRSQLPMCSAHERTHSAGG